MINEEQLSELERITNEATEGPWCLVESEVFGGVILSLRPEATKDDESTGLGVCVSEKDVADYKFIVAARSAVPALIAEVRRLKRQVEWIAAQAPYHESCIYEFRKDEKPDNCDQKCEKCWLREAQDVQ